MTAQRIVHIPLTIDSDPYAYDPYAYGGYGYGGYGGYYPAPVYYYAPAYAPAYYYAPGPAYYGCVRWRYGYRVRVC